MRSGDPKRREERFKLMATGLNNLGVLSIGAGVIGPFFVGSAQPLSVLFGLLFGLTLHGAGLVVLEFVIADDPSVEEG